MPHATVPSPGLQALILCGPGVSLNTFTSNPADLPKALVPIANRPMVWYALDWCYRMGIVDVALVTPPESAPALEAALATHPSLTGLPSPKPDVLSPPLLTQTTGTGELLRLPEVQKRITSDFIVLPCDLIAHLDGSALLQQWMTLNPPSAAKAKAGLAVFYPTHGREGLSTKKDETDFIASVPLASSPVTPPSGSLRPYIEQLVLTMPTDSLKDRLEADKGFLRVRQSLLNTHARVKCRTKWRDAHVYIFPLWVKNFIAGEERLETVSEDVIGWWAKAGWQKGLAAKLGIDKVLNSAPVQSEDGEGDYEGIECDPTVLSSTKTLVHHPKPSPEIAFASRVGTSESITAPSPDPSSISIPPLLAYIQPAFSESSPANTPLIRRVDTTQQLLSLSLLLAKLPDGHALAHTHKIHPTASIGIQSRVSAEDSIVGPNVTTGIRCNIKESVIGAGCELGEGVRLTRCILMDGVIVGPGVVLSGCVIGRRAKIEGIPTAPPPSTPAGSETKPAAKGKARSKDADDDGRTRLTDCEVAPGFIVESGTEAKGEKMMGFDTEDGDFDDDDDMDEE
ncbi:translation initiation factor eIF-2B subunit gamma like protein [Acrodontium crateriforme]|uniref:Translation initiation factor eIF2B subunit gamma n=1 Tax=Acrodontium crateriforme TaxID=150365 RepID=A0AAQ3RA60_9PEZI|nr:translation initiation factor eIF-2B subunit gamma like protein [Acrodontium crateriforme]